MAESGRSYAGVLGAFPYAFRASESRLFRSYAVVGGLVAAVSTLLFAISVVVLLSNTFQTSSGTMTFSRSFVVVVALAIIAPVMGPVLFVARRHRRVGSDPRYDRAMATAGFGFLAAVYLALLVSAPPEYRDPPPDALAPVVQPLYDLPQLAGLLPIVLAGLGIYAVHRRYR